MPIANTTIRIKKSVVSGNIPSTLANGEIAINSADGKLYYATPSGSIAYLTNSQSFATINANSSLILATSPTDTLSIAAGNNISITTNTTTKTVTINSTATGGGGGGLFNYFQNTAPATANSNDYWTNSDTGVMYENFGTPSVPVWAEVGPTGLASNTQPGIFTATSANVSRMNVSYFPISTTGSAIQITAANTVGGIGYADVLQFTNTSAGATKPNKTIRLSSAGELQVVNSTYSITTFNLSDAGDLILSGNSTTNGIAAGYAPNRPAFRVIGVGSTVGSGNTMSGTYWTIDYNQGSYLNNSTGIFTAPVAGLYQVNVVVRTSSNTNSVINQIIIRKTAISGGAVTSIVMVEFAVNTTMNHAGGSTIIKLAAGDTLKFDVTSGSISFDGNDNWSVAYIG